MYSRLVQINISDINRIYIFSPGLGMRLAGSIKFSSSDGYSGPVRGEDPQYDGNLSLMRGLYPHFALTNASPSLKAEFLHNRSQIS